MGVHWVFSSGVSRAATPYLRRPGYAYGGLAVLLVLVFWWDPVIATHRLVPSLLLVAFAVLGTELLRRQVIREFPDHVTPGSPGGAGQGIADRIRGPRVATAGAPAAAAGADPRVGEIERLAGLRDSGALTDDEFAAEKTRILGTA